MMCLGIPGKVVETYRENDVLMGKVDFSGICKRVCLEHVPEVRPGEYVLVHVGFALSRLDEQEAGQVFAFLEEMNQLDELKIDSSPSPPAPLPPGERGAPAKVPPP
jgi:hydrogenase expression/formation protein HypC